MRHAVTDLGAFGVVEPIHRTNEVARDAPDALELHAVADYSVYNREMVELSYGCCIHFQFPRVVRQPRPCPALFVVRFGVRFLLGGERDLNLHRLRVLVHGLVDDLLDVLDERA